MILLHLDFIYINIRITLHSQSTFWAVDVWNSGASITQYFKYATKQIGVDCFTLIGLKGRNVFWLVDIWLGRWLTCSAVFSKPGGRRKACSCHSFQEASKQKSSLWLQLEFLSQIGTPFNFSKPCKLCHSSSSLCREKCFFFEIIAWMRSLLNNVNSL